MSGQNGPTKLATSLPAVFLTVIRMNLRKPNQPCSIFRGTGRAITPLRVLMIWVMVIGLAYPALATLNCSGLPTAVKYTPGSMNTSLPYRGTLTVRWATTSLSSGPRGAVAACAEASPAGRPAAPASPATAKAADRRVHRELLIHSPCA